MPKLPDKNSLGEPASARGARGILTANDFDTGSIIGQGFKKVGAGLNALSDEVHRQSQEDDSLDLMRADVHKTSNILEAERTFDTDTNYDTYGQRYDLAAGAIDQGAAALIKNPKAREKWMLKEQVRNAVRKNSIMDQGLARKREAKVAEIEDILDQHRVNYLNPGLDEDGRSTVERDMDAAIGLAEKQGMVMPNQARVLRQKYMGGAAADMYEQRLMKDPESVIKELQGYQEPAPSADGPEFKARNGQTMRTITSPGGAKLTVNVGVADKFAGLVSDLEAAGIEVKGDQSGGYNDRNIAETSKKSQHASGLAIDINWGDNPRGRKGKIDPKIARDIAAKWGATWGGDWKNPDPMHFEFKDAAPQPMNKRGLTTYAQAKGPTSTDAVESSSLPPVNTGKAHLLSPSQRHALLTRARTAMSAITQQDVGDDIERMRRGKEPALDAQGRTSLEKAKTLLQPNQAAKLDIQWREAQMEHKAITPLESMSEDEATAHIASLAPGNVEDGESYKSAARVQLKAQAKWDKIQKARAEDPVKAVSTDPELKTAVEIAAKRHTSVGLTTDDDGNLVQTETGMAADPDDRRRALGLVFQARLDAQDKRGVPEYGQRILTKKEAADLLQMPSPATMEPKAYRKGLEDAAERAHALYGPEYAAKAVEDAIGFQRGTRDKEKHGIETRILRQIATGEGITRQDVRQYQDLQSVDKIGRFLDFKSQPADDTKPLIGQKTPTDQHVQWLKANIDDPSAIATFDGKFGEGAAARAIYQGQAVKTTGDMGLAQPAAPQKSFLQSLFN